jgi:phosphate-selective porin OprO/OprP
MRYFQGFGGATSPLVAALACLSVATSVAAQAVPPVQPAVTPTAPTSESLPPPAATEAQAPAVTPAMPEVPPPSAVPLAPPPVLAPSEAVPAAVAAEAPAVDPLGANVSFKPGKGVDIKSNDGNWSLNTRLKTQLLYQLNDPSSSDKPVRENFVVRRMRIAFQGNVFTKDIKYKLEITVAGQELTRADPKVIGSGALIDRDVVGQAPLMDAYFDFTQLRDMNLRIGQSKIPYGRERMLSDNEMIVVDRSLEDAEFNFDRDMGVDIRSGDFLGANALHYYLGVFMAEERNASFTSLGVGDIGLLYLARLEFVPLGNFEETPGDFSHGSPKLSIGAAYAFLQTDATSPYARQTLGHTLGSLGDPALIDYNCNNFTADFLFKGGGLSLMGAFHWRKAAQLPKYAGQARDGIGGVVQGGFLLSQVVPVEVAASFGLVRAATNSSLPESNEVTGGLNYYPFNVHALKLQAEYAHIWYQTKTAANYTDNRIRVQLQVLL